MSACEIGATIGKMWRELGDMQKQKFKEEFMRDKVRRRCHFVRPFMSSFQQDPTDSGRVWDGISFCFHPCRGAPTERVIDQGFRWAVF